MVCFSSALALDMISGVFSISDIVHSTVLEVVSVPAMNRPCLRNILAQGSTCLTRRGLFFRVAQSFPYYRIEERQHLVKRNLHLCSKSLRIKPPEPRKVVNHVGRSAQLHHFPEALHKVSSALRIEIHGDNCS